jgi:hypothetical protein
MKYVVHELLLFVERHLAEAEMGDLAHEFLSAGP